MWMVRSTKTLHIVEQERNQITITTQIGFASIIGISKKEKFAIGNWYTGSVQKVLLGWYEYGDFESIYQGNDANVLVTTPK